MGIPVPMGMMNGVLRCVKAGSFMDGWQVMDDPKMDPARQAWRSVRHGIIVHGKGWCKGPGGPFGLILGTEAGDP